MTGALARKWKRRPERFPVFTPARSSWPRYRTGRDRAMVDYIDALRLHICARKRPTVSISLHSGEIRLAFSARVRRPSITRRRPWMQAPIQCISSAAATCCKRYNRSAMLLFMDSFAISAIWTMNGDGVLCSIPWACGRASTRMPTTVVLHTHTLKFAWANRGSMRRLKRIVRW